MTTQRSVYIVRRGNGYAVQVTEFHASGSEHEIDWQEGLTLAEAESLAAKAADRSGDA